MTATEGADGPDEHDPASVRIRGTYTTALTQRLQTAGHEVVQASDPIEERFDGTFATAPASVRIETTRDRLGVECSGPAAAVAGVADAVESAGVDTLRWDDDAPRGAVFDATVSDADGGSGAVVDLGNGERGYLPYDAADGYVDAGDRYRVQVKEPTPPWADDLPRVEPTITVGGGLCTLTRDRGGVRAAAPGETGEELVGLTDLLSVDPPDGWGVRWERTAADADMDAMTTALERATERAERVDDALAAAGSMDGNGAEGDGTNGAIIAPNATEWCWFGRESRFALDETRRAVETTMPGHHRTKAADRGASAAVDFAEAVCGEAMAGAGDGFGDAFGGDADVDFPFAAVTRQFGPQTGDRLALGHGKPDGRLITLGPGEVTAWDADGSLTLERSIRGGGQYDGLGAPKESGDIAVTKLREGRWWYPTTYKRADGTVIGTYVNICTPVECFPDTARYVDLHVDVVRHGDGTVEIVDEDELATAVDDGFVSEALADKATSVANAVARALGE
ncbi:Protein of unknown function (DUF402) [Halovivax ruber XH-70]|uniref:Probable ribonuclease FAU-1 n=1 Tax=Halovivax ruber (strain DSM 18193 / JCM 13892 / XH-70) TaxID=797302 RepID=L0IAE3_HALRX|nr:DUF402 domain-containing protein [Halovivax ruber]AGB14912.1 Protein of unknown function (DUF402) [Halovivax ruber XH-70]